MNEDRNCQWRIAARPAGHVKPTDFAYTEEAIPAPGAGEMLLKTLYLGLAPVMRMYMQGLGVGGQMPLAPGDVIHGRGVAEVLHSNHPDYQAGDIVQGQTGWQTYAVTKATPTDRFYKCKHYDLPYELAAGILGMNGLSAYGGLLDCGQPRAGDLLVVSGAAGGVGTVVVQMARILGCRIIGIAGGPEKCRFVKELGCEQAIDYKNDNVAEKIAAYCPQGMDIYFDNVGGEILSTCLEHLAYEARIVLCGSISEYTRQAPFALSNYTNLRAVNATMKGFFVYNYAERFYEMTDQFAAWIKAGQLKPVQDIVDGFENMPAALARLYDGDNIGVQCCRVRGEPASGQPAHAI